MAASQNIARLGVVLAMDSAELVRDIEEAQKKFGKFKAQIKRDSEDAAKEIVRLEAATRNYGKSLTEVEKVQEQMRLGKYQGQPEVTISNLLKHAAAYDKVAASAKAAEQAKMGKSGGMTAQQQAALGYQTTDIITSLAGGQNPLMVMLQQGGQLRDQFGGFKPLFAGIAASITPIGVAVTAVAGSILGLGFASYKANKEQKEFNDSLALTGNKLNLSEQQFTAMSVALSGKYKVSVGELRDAMQSMASTGQFSTDTFKSVSDLIGNMAHVSGVAASEVAQKLIPSLDGSASSAKKMNDQYHFLSLEQYKQIEALEKLGKKQDAIKLTADALNAKLVQHKDSITPISAAWDTATAAMSSYWQKSKDALKSPDSETKVAQALADLNIANHKAESKAAGEKEKEVVRLARIKYEKLALEHGQYLQKIGSERVLQEAEDAKIGVQAKYGNQMIDLAAKIAEEQEKTKYAIAAKGLDEISQLNLKKKMEDALAEQEIKRKIAENPQMAGQIRDAAKAEATRKKAELELQQANISRDELENYKKKALAEEDSIAKEQQRLDIYKQNLLASDADLQIALSRLKTEQQIAEIEANKKLEADPQGRATEIARLEKIQKAREAVINQAADLKMLQDMNQSVFNNMGNALDNFVRTGKLSFKDLTRSIIQDLIAIAMKAQMMSMFKGFSFFGGGGGGGAPVGDFGGPSMAAAPVFAANGASADAGQPFYVGEQGPELFVPQGAGTIMPNKMVGAMMNNQPQVVYNGPYIANMSAIDTQSGVQFLAKNKSTIWAVNQSAQRSLPASR